ncbi:2-keto-4-pentenoate hydratase [Sphingobium sp. SCG-1]|uniref:2-keto-4-pentenoate hydratase n=1 Tax=Sphingobium sp. SCG-1 TaxID=2072936 RepID=UPI000CD6B625|nr:fumarylacetoacetate hydrolase family protein [Sphingobium sp. SCG-1]AUW57062.1 2-keto-4-pentenoate hydratase [Sphingobium sp. SCG-1]
MSETKTVNTPPHAVETASRFLEARRSAASLPDYPGSPPVSLDEAYVIQDAALSQSAETVGGWKVGRINPPLSNQYGADRLAGPIFASTISRVEPGSTGRIFSKGFGAAEAEFLFRIGNAPDLGKTSFTLEEAAAHIDAVHIGIEIASSPFPGINELGPAVTVSDFGNNNGLIIGVPVNDWKSEAFADVDVHVKINGVVVGTGRASGFTDGAVGSVRFLLEHLARRGIAIKAGDWISTGAVSGVHPVKEGDRVEANFGSLGMMECTIVAQQAQ